MKRGADIFIVAALIFILFSWQVFAAGGGGGGGGSSGLGFTSSRDSVFTLVNMDYSAKFSLKNNTKYELKVNVDDGNVTVNFGSYYFELKDGDNFADLNENGLADINFKLESIKGSRADIRIIDAGEQIQIKKDVEKNEKLKIEERIKGEKENNEEGLKCGNLSALKERVKCRLEQEEEQEEELNLSACPTIHNK
ncbi:hypothetical protein HYW19_03420 [Candidatus Woesearchaeota archaeon]|nr:hypothetical protein [Candidatus Woesearchaeota archaeon]